MKGLAAQPLQGGRHGRAVFLRCMEQGPRAFVWWYEISVSLGVQLD
jgi:hypothetical protein